ncbi:hypothetical protein ACTFIZ_003815 [Dictyostelium cf. discoideum]
MKFFKVSYLSIIFIFIKLSLSFVNSEFLKIDSYDNSTCKDKLSIYSSEWIKLNYCDGNIIYRFVPPNVGGGITENSTTTTSVGNSSTTTTTSATSIITSLDILTTAISSMTGFGALNADFLLESNESQNSNEIQTTTTSTTSTTSSSNDIGTTSTTSTTTTTTKIPTTTLTSLSITTTGIFQNGMGSVVKYYCLSIGCSAQCVSIQVFPLGVCTSSNGLDNVLYSIVDNTSSIITKSTNITNPGINNGFCQSFISPKSCISSLNKVTQYKNDHCGKGLKINCTGSLYTSFTCLDNDCNQCTNQSNSYQLNKCILLNNGSSGAVFRSVLKTPITDFTLPPLDSSNSDYDSLIPQVLYLPYLNKAQLICITNGNSILSDVFQNQPYTGYVSSDLQCDFNFKYLLFDSYDPISPPIILPSFDSGFYLQGEKISNFQFIYSFNITIESGQTNINLTISDSYSYYQLKLNCISSDTPSLYIKFLNEYPFISSNKYYSIIESNTEGKDKLVSNEGIATLITGNQYEFIWNPEYIEKYIYSQTWDASFTFYPNNIIVSSKNPFYYKNENVNIHHIKYYPNLINVKESGNGLSPVMTFVTNSTDNYPYQYIPISPSIYTNCVPIYGNINNMTYSVLLSDKRLVENDSYSFKFATSNSSQPKITTLTTPIFNITDFMPDSNILTELVLYTNIKENYYNALFKPTIDGCGYFDFQFQFQSNSFIRGFPFGYVSRLLGGSCTFKFTFPFFSWNQNQDQYFSNGFYPFFKLDESSSIPINISSPTTNDISPPEIIRYDFLPFSGPLFILKLDITDESGVSKVFIDQNSSPFEIYTGSKSLTYGTIFNGTWFLRINALLPIKIIVSDIHYNERIINEGDILIVSPSLLIFNLPSSFKSVINYSNIKNLTFSTNNIDLTNYNSYNYIRFNLTDDIPIGKPMAFRLMDPISYKYNYNNNNNQDQNLIDEDSLFPIIWDETLNLYEAWFILPKLNLFGNIQYSIITSSKTSLLSGFLPTQLTVTLTNLDNLGPMVTHIKSVGGGWLFTIQDDFNGFNKGFIKLIGNFDKSTFKKNFTSINIDSGNLLNGIYFLNFTLPSIEQSYRIVYLELEDSNGIKSIYNIFEKSPSPINNPLRSFLNSTTPFNLTKAETPDFSITLVATGTNPTPTALSGFSTSTTDGISTASGMATTTTTSGGSVSSNRLLKNNNNNNNSNNGGYGENSKKKTNLKAILSNLTFNASLNINESIDVGDISRTISFDFQVTDTIYSLRSDQLPVIYIVGMRLETFECQSKIQSIISNKSIVYHCDANLPLGFGYPGQLSYSLYGILNVNGDYVGYSNQDLASIAPNYYYVNTELSMNKTVIISTEKITTLGGRLIIFCKSGEFVSESYVTYGNGTTQRGQVSFASPSVVIINISQTFLDFSVYLIRNNSQYSNTVTVSPILFTPSNAPTLPPTLPPTPTPPSTLTPTPTPSSTSKPTCLGSPQCGGVNKGTCGSNGECICFSPWVGLDCSSQLIIIPKPITNTSQPTTEIPITGEGTNNVLFKSLVSIVSLRELDFNGKQIKIFIFDSWIFDQISSTKSQYYTNITTTTTTTTTTTPPSNSPITVNIKVIIEWFNESTSIEFAKQTLIMNPSTIKFTIEITEYPFSSKLSQLQLVMSALFESEDKDVCSVKNFNDFNDNNYLKIQIENRSLYGRFIKRALLDNTSTSISNVLLGSDFNEIGIDENYNIKSYIGITIPQFSKLAQIDPDFSLILDPDSANDNPNSVCSQKSGLSTIKIVGIVIGSFVFLAAIIFAISYTFYKKKLNKKLLSNFAIRLKQHKENKL